MKIGRNEPCHCGSGKKYKKCCLRKDEEREVKAHLRDDELFEDDNSLLSREDEVYDDDDDEVYDDDDDDDMDAYVEELSQKIPKKKAVIKQISDAIPEISDDEGLLIDDWFDHYANLESTDEKRKSIDDFFDTYPELVPNMELQMEVLFELGADYIREGRHREYIDLLLRFRKEFTSSYLKSHAYYDYDIISFLVMTGRKDEIPEYLEFFKEYPDNDPANLFKVIAFLSAHNCQEILIPFVRQIYADVLHSPNVMYYFDILDPLIFSYYLPCLKPGYSHIELETLSQDLKGIEWELGEVYYHVESLKKEINAILEEPGELSIGNFKTTKEIYRLYHEITRNFILYLHDHKGKDWMASFYYAGCVYEYLVEVIPEGKRPKTPFIFTEDKINTTISKLSKEMMFLNSVKVFSYLNAISWFGEFLGKKAFIDQEMSQMVQLWCRELFGDIYDPLVKRDFPAKTFEKFPFES